MKQRIYNRQREIKESVPDRDRLRGVGSISHRGDYSSLEMWCAEASWKSLKNRSALPPIIPAHMGKIVWIYSVQ